MIRESDVEDYLARRLRELGGKVRKMRWIGRHSAPDRCAMLNGRHWLVELKRPGEKARPAQEREHRRLRDDGGFVVVVLTSFDEVDKWLESVSG